MFYPLVCLFCLLNGAFSHSCSSQQLKNYGINLDFVHHEDIYETFKNGPNGPAQRDVQFALDGWGVNEEAFGEILNFLNSSFIVEVGSWKGLSAVTMANHMRKYAPCGVIMCVDTWLGTPRAWTHFGQFGNGLDTNAGFPSVYYDFLFNVKSSGVSNNIIPLPMPSTQGILYLDHVLKYKKPDLIFIDACHDYKCILADVQAWYPLVAAGGTLFGDDYQRGETKKGVHDALIRMDIPLSRITSMNAGRYWLLKKVEST